MSVTTNSRPVVKKLRFLEADIIMCPSHMSLCRDERSTTETEINDNLVDSFQVAIRWAQTKTSSWLSQAKQEKSVDSFQVAIRCAQTKTSSWLKQSKKNCKFFEAQFSRAAGCGSYPSYSYPAGSSKAKKIAKFSKL